MEANGMNKKSIVEIIQLSESYTDIPSSSSSSGSAAPRISFSSEEEAADVAAEEDDCSADGGTSSSSSEAEFEFSSTGIQAQASTADPPISMADELFYNGKLLPLEPMSRMAMVHDLSQEEEIGTMRRGRSTRTPARPHFQIGPCTRKSSSYPPPGCSSRPPPTRKWKDLFGLKKQQHQAEAGKPTSSSKALLKMAFFNKGSSSTTPAASNEAPSSAPKNQASSSKASSDARSQNSSAWPRKSRAPIKLGHAAGSGGIAGGSRAAAAAAITADAHKLSPPPSPLRSYAKATVNVAPVLHVPAYITSLKPFRRESRSPVEVL